MPTHPPAWKLDGSGEAPDHGPMLTPANPQFEARVRDSFARQPFMAHLGAELGAVTPGHCEIQLPYRPSLTQQHGYFHAGAIATLADNAAGYAAFSLMPEDASVLSVEFKLNLMAPGQGDRLVARAEVLKAGRTLTVCESRVFGVLGGQERLCAVALVTLMTMAGKPDAPASAAE
jgi:uncharacterized protein (TIGR00369 family)